MKFKIGIYGSAVSEGRKTTQKARELGQALAQENIILVTGACSGIPYVVASEVAKQQPSEIWGYSPVVSRPAQKKHTPHDDLSIYTKFIFVPKNFPFLKNLSVSKKYRNVISTANCDAGIILAGRWGTLNEFTNLIDFGKVVGVLTETGGIANELPHLSQKIKKAGSGKIVFSRSPQQLVKKILQELDR